MYQYADTVEFDLVVVFLVVCVMPLAVFLMQSKTKVGRAMSLALMVLAVLYVGGFEHYRMHRPEVTEGGLKAAVFPSFFLDLVESETFELNYLPIGADPEAIAVASAGIDHWNATIAEYERPATAPRRAAPGERQRQRLKNFDAAGEPLVVHLSHKGAGDRMFRDALRALERNTCANETESSSSSHASSSPVCMRWCSGTAEDFRHDVHTFSFDRSTPRDMGLLGRPYRAVFIVRDPRDLIAESYLEHLDTSEAWARLPRDDLGGESFQSKLRSMSAEDGVDVEIDRFTASLSVKLGIQKAIGHLYQGDTFMSDAVDSRVGDFARSLRAFARADDPNVVFVKYEELLRAKTDGLTLLSEWLGLKRGTAEMRAFVDACVDAREDAREDARVGKGGGNGGGGGGDGDKDESNEGADAEIYSLCEGGGCEERSRRARRTLPPGAWREHFTDRNAEKFEREHGALLRSMGYYDFQEIARI